MPRPSHAARRVSRPSVDLPYRLSAAKPINSRCCKRWSGAVRGRSRSGTARRAKICWRLIYGPSPEWCNGPASTCICFLMGYKGGG